MEIFTIIVDINIFKKISNFIIQLIFFDTPMPPSRGDKVVLQNGTVKTDKVSMRDVLIFYYQLIH